MIHDYDSLTIFGWMINKLKLEGVELLVYAKLFNDGQDGGPIPKDIEYLKKFIGHEENSILNALRSLEQKNLVIHMRVYRDISNCYVLNFDTLQKGGVR